MRPLNKNISILFGLWRASLLKLIFTDKIIQKYYCEFMPFAVKTNSRVLLRFIQVSISKAHKSN